MSDSIKSPQVVISDERESGKWISTKVAPAKDGNNPKSELELWELVRKEFERLGWKVGPILDDANNYSGLYFDISEGDFNGFVIDPDYQVRFPHESLQAGIEVNFVVHEDEKETEE